MINKTRFRVANDKKILHKIGKRWVTVSALTLALLGGGAVASTTITHADTTTPTTTAQANGGVKEQLNDNLNKTTNSNASVPKVSIGSASAQSNNVAKPSAVQSQASNLHKGLMLNATQPSIKSSASASSSNDNGIITLNMGTKSEQDRSWNFVQHGINNDDYAPTNKSGSSVINNSASNNQTTPVSSASAKSNVSSNSVSAKPSFNSAYKSYMAQMSGADSKVASANAVNADSNSNKNEKNKALLKDDAQPNYFNGGVIKTGNDDGLNYKVYKNGGVEFTDGTANSDLSKFIENKFNSDIINSDVYYAKAIKFDNAIDTSKVTNMSDMFYGDYSLQSLTLPNSFDTHNVTDMNEMFSGDYSLQSLILPSSFNTSKVTNMSDMFVSNYSLQSLTLPNSFNTHNVTDMQAMFSGDNSLQSLTLPNSFNTSKVTNMSDMFGGDYALQSLTLPSSFDTHNVTDMNEMFYENTHLQSLRVQSLNTRFDESTMVPQLYKELPQKDNNSKNYTLSTPNDFNKGNLGTFIPKNPKSVTDTINYQDGNTTKGSYTINGYLGDSDKLTNIPNGYKLSNPSQSTITLNGSNHNIAINKIINDWDTISYEYQPNNQNDYYEVINQGQAYGQQGSTYNIQSSDIPKGYQLVNPNNSFTFGSSDGFHRIMIKPSTNTHIPAIPNTVNIKGTVDLHFIDGNDGNKTKDIKLDYLTQDSDDKQINLLRNVDYNNGSTTKPSDFVKNNTNIQGFDVSNFTYTGATNNYDGTQYTPSKSDTDYNHGSTNLLVKNITLNFKAKSNTDPIQNGSTSLIEYIDNGKIISSQPVNSSTGSKIDPSSYVPKGYQVVSDNNGQKSFANDGSTHNIEVTGNTIPSTTIKVTQPNGTQASIPVNNHKIGDKITINPNQYAPAGYQANPSDNPITVTIVPSDNGQGYSFKPSGNDTTTNAKNNVFNNNTVSYNYHYDPDKAGNTVTVKYKNHSGQIVGTKTFNVPQGTKINPNSDTPSDYTDDGSNKPITAASDGKPSTVIYNVKGSKTASQLPSTTNRGKIHLHIVEKSNGNQVNSYNVTVDEGSKLVGSDFTINPMWSKDDRGNSLIPKGYLVNSTDNIIKGVITSNGAITNNGTDTLIYDAMGENGYNIHYQDPSDPNNAKNDIVVSTNNDKTGQHLTNANVPNGYHLPSDTSFSFNSDGNIINDKTGQQVPDNRVPLEGNDIQGKANIVLKYQILDPTGKVVKTIYNNADDAQVILNGTVGGSEKINPWRYWKQDYTVPANAQQSDTIHFTPSDVNANDENGQQFNPTLTYTATAQQAGDVVVNYVDTDNHNEQISQQDLGNFNDLVGQTVKLGQKEPSDNDANINNDSDVKYVLEVPQGYHLEYNANPITLAEGKVASSNPTVHYPKSGLGMLFNASRFYHRPVGLFLTVGLSNPMKHKNNNASSATTNSSTNSSSNSSASDSNSMIPAIATNTNSASSSASSSVDSLNGNTYITTNNTSNTSNITNNYNYSNSSTSMATNSSEVKANANSNANDTSARTTSDNADKSGMIDINNRPSKIINTTTSRNHSNNKISKISNRLPMKNHYYVYSPKDIVLYGKHNSVKISRKRGFTGKIMKVVKFHGKKAFVISWKHKMFTVIARQTKNAYVQPKEFRRHMHGLIKHATIKLRKTSVIYNSVNFNKHTAKRAVKAGKKLTVIGLKSFGEKGYKRTRFVLSNGLIINANKNYVELI